MNVVQQIPNLLTLGNLTCGVLAMLHAYTGNFDWAAYLILTATGLDLLDGLLARALGVSSEMGKQLDALSDLVSFGVAPAMIMFLLFDLAAGYRTMEAMDVQLLAQSGLLNQLYEIKNIWNLDIPWTRFAVVFLPVCAAIRLAKFNNQADSKVFYGLPTPAVGIYTAGLILILNVENPETYDLRTIIEFMIYPKTLLFSVFLLAIWMIVPLKMMTLKFEAASWKGNEWRFTFLAISGLTVIASMLISFVWIAIPIILALYLIFSVFYNIYDRNEIQSSN